MKALVTGGCGFIGSHLVRILLEEGISVRILDLPDVSRENLRDLDFEDVQGDIRDREDVSRALEGVQWLFHTAANPHLWARDKGAFHSTNVEGTRTVLEAASQAELERVVYTSTESILVPPRAEEPITEDSSPRLEDMVGPYCRSKYLAEQEALRRADEGLPVVIVNPTMPVGPGDRRLTPPSRMILDFLEGKISAYMGCPLNLVHVRDVSWGHLLAARKGTIGKRYILGGENLTDHRVFEMLAEIDGRRAPRLKVPGVAALAYAHLSEFVANHFTGKPPMAGITGVRLALRGPQFDSQKAVRELGLPRTPIRQALEEAVHWFRENGFLVER